MDQTILDGVIKIVGGSSVAGILFFFLYGGWKKEPWWVFARHHEQVVDLLNKQILSLVKERDDRIKELVEERDAYRLMTSESVDMARAAMDLEKARLAELRKEAAK